MWQILENNTNGKLRLVVFIWLTALGLQGLSCRRAQESGVQVTGSLPDVEMVSELDQGVVELNANRIDTLSNAYAQVLAFSNIAGSESTHLILSSPWMSTVLAPIPDSTGVYFAFKEELSKIAGTWKWTLLQDTGSKSGKFHILPSSRRPDMLESYFGPSHLRATTGERADFVVLPMDIWGNSLAAGQKLVFNGQFKGDWFQETVESKGLIAYRSFPEQGIEGKYQANAILGKVNSRIRKTEVLAGYAHTMEVSIDRRHDYADGNSILQVTAGPVLDSFGQAVPDGTMVRFKALDKEDNLFQSSGITVAGFASAFFQFPAKATVWNMVAYTREGASGNFDAIQFQKAVTHCPVMTLEDGFTFDVGPVTLVQGGTVADGFLFEYTLQTAEGQHILSDRIPLRSGKGRFTINPKLLKPGAYTLHYSCGDAQGSFPLSIPVQDEVF